MDSFRRCDSKSHDRIDHLVRAWPGFIDYETF